MIGSKILGNIILSPSVRADIAVVNIREEDRLKINYKFQDESGRETPCLLYKHSLDRQSIEEKFDLVFIRGATTRLGKGKILYKTEEQNNCPNLLIQNRADNESDFCREGDSGSIVCAKGRDRNLYALALIKGSDEEGRFVAVMLEDALKELGRVHNVVYKILC